MSSERLPNGNICLTFKDSISQQITQFAERHFSGIADGYLLGPECIPHITLCQIHHDKPQPRAFRRDLGQITAAPETIRLEKVMQRPASNGDYTWLQFTIAPTPEWLTDTKAKVETLLRSYGITSLTPSGADYAPHVTLCRIKTSGKQIDVAPNVFTIDPGQLHLALGGSGPHGQLQKAFWQQLLT